MSTKIEFYQRLREHIPEPAARMIADEMVSETEMATKQDLASAVAALATKEGLHRVELSVERLRSSMFRWQLMFFIPLWVGVYGTLVAIVLRGSP